MRTLSVIAVSSGRLRHPALTLAHSTIRGVIGTATRTNNPLLTRDYDADLVLEVKSQIVNQYLIDDPLNVYGLEIDEVLPDEAQNSYNITIPIRFTVRARILPGERRALFKKRPLRVARAAQSFLGRRQECRPS